MKTQRFSVFVFLVTMTLLSLPPATGGIRAKAQGPETTEWELLEFAGKGVLSIAFSPNYANDHTIYAGTYDNSGSSLFRSTDKAANWTFVDIGTPFSLRSTVISPNYPNDRTLFIGGGAGGGVRRSTDDGANWASVGPNGETVRALAISPDYANDRTLFAGTETGHVFRSEDGGDNWVDAGLLLPGGYAVLGLAISPNYANDRTVFAGMLKSWDWYHGGVYRSTNGGDNWVPVNNGLTYQAAWALAISPNYSIDQTLFVAVWEGGVYRSTNSGDTWVEANNGQPNRRPGNGPSLVFSPNYANDQTLFFGTWGEYNNGGVYRSTDGGASWTVINAGLTTRWIHSLAVPPNYESEPILLAGGELANGGGLWIHGRTALPNIEVTVELGNHFFSVDDNGDEIPIEGQPEAYFPFRVYVTKDGTPAPGAELRLIHPFQDLLGTTNSEGVLETALAVPSPPVEGDLIIEVTATTGGYTESSGVVTLYNARLRTLDVDTLTAAEAEAYSNRLLWHHLTRPGLPKLHVVNAPPLFEFLGHANTIIGALAALVQVSEELAAYSPQGGDAVAVAVSEYTAPGVTTAYVYREYVQRDDNLIYDHIAWTEQWTEVEPYTHRTLARTALITTLVSPTTALLIAPDGGRAGVDPTTADLVFDFAIAISEPGDEPYFLIAPDPTEGEYTLQVTGTGSGSYLLTIYALDHNGDASAPLPVPGLTESGYITEIRIRYEPSSGSAVTPAVVGTVDTDPDSLNLNSKAKESAVTAYIELPLGFDVSHIDPLSVSLEDIIPAQPRPTEVGDHNHNGIPDLMVKFDRQAVMGFLNDSGVGAGQFTLTVAGTYFGPMEFVGHDSITVVTHE